MLAAAMAPAIVRSGSLMKVVVPKVIIPSYLTLWGDGVHDDTQALQHLLAGGLVMSAGGVLLGGNTGVVRIPSGNFNISDTLRFKRSNVELLNSTVTCTKPVDYMISFDAGVSDCRISGVHFQGAV